MMCNIYIYIWCVIDMVKCQWTTVVLLSESAKEQSAQTTDRLDLCALHIVYGYIYMCILYIHIVYLYII